MTPELNYRAPINGEMGFVYSFWRDSFGESAWVRDHKYAPREFKPIANAILDKLVPRCTIVVAEFPDAPGVLVGFAAKAAGMAMYVYVKPAFCHVGIGHELLRRIDCRPPEGAWRFDPATALERIR